MDKAFGLSVVILCLSLTSEIFAAPSSERHQNTLPTCTEKWNSLHVTVDNDFDIYVEGTKYDYVYNANNWMVSSYVPLVWYPTVVAVRAYDNGVIAGILGSSELFVTDGSWKCTNQYVKDWEKPSFDDSTWPSATEIGTHGVEPWGQIYGISSNAKWIWTSNYNYGPDSDKTVYCRKTFCQRCPTTGERCIKSCEGLADGPYQSCNGCSTFIMCDHGVVRERLCPDADANGNRLKWDDVLKTCNYESNTCRDCDGTTPVESTTPVPSTPPSTETGLSTSQPCTGTGPSCITSCHELRDGDYQSCKGCQVYASCSGGILYDERPCAPSEKPTYWDDDVKRCEWESRTCTACSKK